MQEVITQVKSERAAAGTADQGTGGNEGGSTLSSAMGSSASHPSAKTDPEMGFMSMTQADQAYWEKYIEKLIRTYVQLIPDQKTQPQLENLIRDCPLSASIRGDPTGLILYHYDVKQSGEPQTRADLRISPVREAIYHRLVRAVLNARAPAGQAAHLRTGEVAIIVDGGRKGNASKLLAPWREGTTKDSKKKADDEEDDDGGVGAEASERPDCDCDSFAVPRSVSCGSTVRPPS